VVLVLRERRRGVQTDQNDREKKLVLHRGASREGPTTDESFERRWKIN
jgi:hypothetical protein